MCQSNNPKGIREDKGPISRAGYKEGEGTKTQAQARVKVIIHFDFEF